jgi:hypothetical protein
MATETVHEFKARGGKIVKLPTGGRKRPTFMKVRAGSVPPGVTRARVKHIKLARAIDARAAA